MRPRIHLLYESDRFGNPHGSGHIRLLRPFFHPSMTDCFDVTAGGELPEGDIDVVVVERGWRADTSLDMAEALVDKVRLRGAALIYTLDDNLLDLHRGQPWYEFSTDVKRNIVRYFLRHADSVVVSTESLKQRLQRLNPNVVVAPNALDERLFLETEQKMAPLRGGASGKITFGYMGTHSHLRDLLMVLEPLRALLRKHQGRVEFQLVGISEDSRIVQSFESLSFTVLDTAGNHFYPDFISWARLNLNWDFAIAPLEDSLFTRSKSDIKFLDYSLLGIPGIYSDVEAYQNSVNHEITGYLTENTSFSWLAALEWMVENDVRRRAMAGAAYSYVADQRILKHCTGNWKNVIFPVAENRA